MVLCHVDRYFIVGSLVRISLTLSFSSGHSSMQDSSVVFTSMLTCYMLMYKITSFILMALFLQHYPYTFDSLLFTQNFQLLNNVARCISVFNYKVLLYRDFFKRSLKKIVCYSCLSLLFAIVHSIKMKVFIQVDYAKTYLFVSNKKQPQAIKFNRA